MGQPLKEKGSLDQFPLLITRLNPFIPYPQHMMLFDLGRPAHDSLRAPGVFVQRFSL